jgi:hypothetical protein
MLESPWPRISGDGDWVTRLRQLRRREAVALPKIADTVREHD